MNLFQTILAQAAPAADGGGTSILGNPLILFGAIILIFYFMIIRPQQKKMKDHQSLMANLTRGDKVVMSGGIHGTIFEVKDKTILVDVAKNTVLEYDKGSVQSVSRDTPATT